MTGARKWAKYGQSPFPATLTAQIALFLAAVVVAPLFRRLRLGKDEEEKIMATSRASAAQLEQLFESDR
jgi:hypothetical protein